MTTDQPTPPVEVTDTEAMQCIFERFTGTGIFDNVENITFFRELLARHRTASTDELLEGVERAVQTLAASRHLLTKYCPEHHWLPEHDERIDALKTLIAKHRPASSGDKS